ncbi:MAG: TolC family protein [Pseudomonadota bacterium]|nr:TolC family protein [Pseudomonadota bacterium]
MFNSLLHAVALAVALLPAAAIAAPLTLDQALDLAVQRSEAARAARAGVASAAQAARAAGQLPDPVFRVGVDNLPVTGGDRFSTTRDTMTMKRIGIGQEWISGDKRAARQAAADAMLDRESVMVQAAAADVRLQTALAYLDAYYAGESLKLTAFAEHHLHEEFEAAKGRLSAASASAQEVLAASSARGIAEDESSEVRQQQSAARVALERWVGVASSELSPPAGLYAVAEQAYVDGHPSVLAARSDLEIARQDANLASSNRKPNWSWELSFGQRSGYSDMVSVGVSIPLPVAPAERQDREIGAKLALVDKAQAALAEATHAAQGEFRVLASDSRRLAERIERYQASVVVPAGERTTAAMAGYGANQLTLTTLFDARHMELQAQQKLLKLQRDLAKTQAQLVFKPLVAGDAR